MILLWDFGTCFIIIFGKAPVSDSTLAVKPQVTLKLQTPYLFYYFFFS